MSRFTTSFSPTVCGISALAIGVFTLLPFADAQSAPDPNKRCTNTTTAADTACRKEAGETYWIEKGKCENVPAPGARSACINDAKQTHQDDLDECDAQLDARAALCDELGESAYAPPTNPANFTTTIDNPFLPWIPGMVFVYEATNGEEVTVTVTDQIEVIGGVSCVVVHDVGTVGGELIEDTFDYYAQDMQGNVWYFGEDTVQYEDGRIAGVEGAWRTGVDGAKPGIAMEADPAIDDVYRQEFLLGEAEDEAKVVSTTATETVPFGGAYNNLLVTAETSSLEPDTLERKFYSSGLGQILTIDDETGDREELVSVTGP